MGKKHVTVDVDGIGKVKVRLPRVYDKENVANAIFSAVLQTLNMVEQAKTKETFHPAMGMKARDEI